MNVRFWGVRGSVPTPGPSTGRYGGNTACVEIAGVAPEHLVVLDAGTGIRPLGLTIGTEVRRIDLLLSHLHMDHILGLGFFEPLFRSEMEVHIWGPSSSTLGLRERLARYLSPPLFPVALRELPCQLVLHDLPLGTFELPGLEVTAGLVLHPGPTVGYRLAHDDAVLTYLSDHEPALGSRRFPEAPRWTSGFDLAADADILVHDAQYDDAEYEGHIGWGHSTITHAIAFAEAVGAQHLVAFHYDPSHDDDHLDRAFASLSPGQSLIVTASREGDSIDV
jgi:ribonuclease BN (tRNA processing enzyme)